MTREWPVPCVFCGRKTWTVNPVCRSRKCRQLEEKYRVRSAAAASHTARSEAPRSSAGLGANPSGSGEGALAAFSPDPVSGGGS